MTEEHIVGCILGAAVGDALGLPYEGLSRSRGPRLFGPPDRHRFFFGRGMVSDDTEHICMAAQSLIAADDIPTFLSDFAWRLRWWLLGLPAGIDRATLYSCVKLWFGASPQRSGVFSAGNGPAMRAAIFGAALEDRTQMLEYVRAASRVTHSDPKAEYGAVAVALAARYARFDPSITPIAFVDDVADELGEEGEELVRLLRDAAESVENGQTTEDFAEAAGLGRGVSGYTYHTVPVAIHAWLSHPQDYRAAVTSVICCGGDCDTTGAIVGGVVGTTVGEEGIPRAWMDTLGEWPRTVDWMRDLGRRLATAKESQATFSPPGLNPLALLLRNLLFLAVVLLHGFRRLAPPY